MRTLDPTIDYQVIIYKQIYEALQGDLLLDINKVCEGNGYMIFNQSINDGNNLRILPNTLPDLYATCMEVVNILGYNSPIDFYVAGDSSVNAHSVATNGDDVPDQVVINSAMVNLFSTDELKYVIGHEIGHLINGDTMLKNLERFVYPNDDDEPDYIATRTNLYDHLSELGADRWGYMACENLDACITACYKMASGLDLNAMKVSISGLIDEAYVRVKDFFDGKLDLYGDHPVIPMRVVALHQFATAKTKKALDENLFNIIAFTYAQTEEDVLFGDFAAAAGLHIAKLDGKFDNLEKAFILEKIGDGQLFPERILKEIEKSGNVEKLFPQIASELVEKYPESKKRMLEFFIDLALVDKNLTREEVDQIFRFAQSIDIPDPVTADFLRDKIRGNYVPRTL